MPVVAMSFIGAVATDLLVPAAPVTGISYSVIIIITPWFRAIYNYFIAMIHVVIAVSYRQIRPANPYVTVKIYILMSGNIIINAYIGHIVIVSMGITDRAAFRLNADIHTYI